MTDTSTPGPAASPGEGSSALPVPRRRRRRRLLAVIAAVVVAVVAAVGIYAWTIDHSITSNIRRGIDLPGGSATASAEPRATGPLNYVLLGSDSRNPDDAAQGRSDTIMLVHLDRARDKASIISFPRDMYVTIPGHGKNKINAAYALGGPALTVRTLEELTGVHVDHVALVDFEGFVALTDDLGGVTVTNKTAFTSHGYTYPKGKITISGKKALWFVRERHALPNGDLDRAANQRNVIKAIVAKGLSPQVVSDPIRFTSFVGNLSRHVTVDNNLSDAEIRSTALSLRLQADDITLLQAPLSGFGTSPTGESIDLVDRTKMAALAQALRDDTLPEYLAKYPER